MNDDALRGFLVHREMDDPISEIDLVAAIEASGRAIAELRTEGVDIRWNSLEVLRNEDNAIVGLFCHYLAGSEDVIEDYAERADWPISKIMPQSEPMREE